MAYNFNGTNQSSTTPNAPVLSEPLTIAAWFYPTRNTARTVIASIADTAQGASAAFFALVEDGTKAGDPICATKHRGSATSPPDSEATSTSGFTINNWHHGCAVFTSNTSRTIYLNGGSSATDTTNIPIDGNAIDKTGIACLARSTNAAFFQGRAAEVGIWNVALTADEVASLAKGMTCDKVRPQSLVFYAPLVRDLIDVKGGLTITNNNTATVANHPRVYA